MKLICLTEPELVGIKVKWSADGPKSPTLINAARAAGFSNQEIEGGLGILEEDFMVSATEIAKAGGIVLMGTNGTMLLELHE